MNSYDPAYLYTLHEARNLIPEIRPLLEAMRLEHRQLRDSIASLEALTPAMRQNGFAMNAADHERSIVALGESLQEKLDHFDLLGIEVKDLDSGIIDFPSEYQGRVVFLCWQVDEETVSHWHETDAGFASRQRVDE
jgi:hypothetical protein